MTKSTQSVVWILTLLLSYSHALFADEDLKQRKALAIINAPNILYGPERSLGPRPTDAPSLQTASSGSMPTYSKENTINSKGYSLLNFFIPEQDLQSYIQAKRQGVEYWNHYPAMVRAIRDARLTGNPALEMLVQSDVDEWQLVHKLAARNKLAQLKALDREQLLARTHFGRNALMIAIQYRHQEAARYLSQYEELLDHKDDFGFTPLLYAVATHSQAIQDYLLDLTPRPRAITKFGYCASYTSYWLRTTRSKQLTYQLTRDTAANMFLQDFEFHQKLASVAEAINPQKTQSACEYAHSPPQLSWHIFLAKPLP